VKSPNVIILFLQFYVELIDLGDLCAAKFVDNQWYRAKVEKVSGPDVAILYVDYGNRAVVPRAKCGSLPSTFSGQAPFAKEYALALCQLPTHDVRGLKIKIFFYTSHKTFYFIQEDYKDQAIKAMKEDLLDKKFKLNVEYRIAGQVRTLPNNKTIEPPSKS